MTDSPRAVNTEADKANKVVNWIFHFLMQLAINVAEGKFPFLKIWPLGWIIESLGRYAEEQLSKPVRQEATHQVIKYQIDSQVHGTTDATEDLRVAILSRDQDAIKKANDKFNEKWGNLIHDDGFSTNAH